MKLLITGATGCLGRHLITKLALAKELQITAVGRNTTIGNMLLSSNTKFVTADIGDRDKIFQLIKHQDAVIHCAALSTPWGKFDDFYLANVTGTQNLLDASLASNISRFIHISTPSIYFDGRSRTNIHESTVLPNKFINHYAHTKKLGEDRVDQAFLQGLPTITIRPRGIFGPYDTAIFPRLIRVAQHGSFPLISAGKSLIDVTYVENVVDAIILCLQASNLALGKKYNITNNQPLSVNELLKMFFAMLNLPIRFYSIPYSVAYGLASILELIHHLPIITREPLLTRYTVGLLGHSQTLDIQSAKTDLGYTPKISLIEGLEKFAYWWQKEGIHAR